MAVKFYDERSLTIREGISRRSKRVLSKSQFPHYTWGYIAVLCFTHFGFIVPSLYVRVYRNWAQMKGYLFRSLTIREGISPKRPPKPGHLKFPHYTWGYIGMPAFSSALPCVPSLYVRVYRKRDEWPKGGHPFPHYTWGYIDITNGRRTTTPVPSLYVRVYRTENEVLLLWDGSFTIREGIS